MSERTNAEFAEKVRRINQNKRRQERNEAVFWFLFALACGFVAWFALMVSVGAV